MKKSKDAPAAKQLPFEEAIEQLEEMVQQLEGGALSLDDALATYEKGIQLAKACQEQLDRAELRIQKLTGVGPDGEPVTEPFDG